MNSIFFLANYKKKMKYKVGDRVRIKSKAWYEDNKDDDFGEITTVEPVFVSGMSKYCGRIATIVKICKGNAYYIDIDSGRYYWSDEMFEETLYLPGDKVKMKSREWFEENKNEAGVIEREIAYINNVVAEDILGEIVTIKNCTSSGYQIKEHAYRIYDDWTEGLAGNSWNEIKTNLECIETIVPGSPVVVCDRYHEDGPREDWTIATFVGARVKGVDTEHGIWNYCMSLSAFLAYYQVDWKTCLENTYTGKDKQLIKINE